MEENERPYAHREDISPSGAVILRDVVDVWLVAVGVVVPVVVVIKIVIMVAVVVVVVVVVVTGMVVMDVVMVVVVVYVVVMVVKPSNLFFITFTVSVPLPLLLKFSTTFPVIQTPYSS